MQEREGEGERMEESVSGGKCELLNLCRSLEVFANGVQSQYKTEADRKHKKIAKRASN